MHSRTEPGNCPRIVHSEDRQGPGVALDCKKRISLALTGNIHYADGIVAESTKRGHQNHQDEW